MSQPRPVAIVTGAARRVGRAIALDLAKAGFDLILTYRTSRADMEETVELARRASAAPSFSAQVHVLDLSDPPAVDRWSRPLRELPHLDALVHNASSYARSPFGAIRDDEAMRHYRVNALAPLLLCQALADPLGRSILPGGGAVVCFGDIHVMGRPRRDFAAYSMSKAALMQMVQCLALDMAPTVRVNAIAPGVIAWPNDTPPAERERYEARIPLGRSGTPEDAAALVRWLILEATYITGEVIRLDGGRWLR